MRRRALPALVSLAFLAAAGPGSSATLKGSAGPDTLVGTGHADTIYGFGGNDRLEGRGGNDFLSGGLGSDVLLGGAGDDRIAAEADQATDEISCGPGHDVVTAGLTDRVDATCEVVSRQLSRDVSRARGAQHESEVEPSSFSFRSTIVTAFQAGRFGDDGAASIGYATSRNGGRTWHSGWLPRLSIFAAPPGIYGRVSDPVVAYDAAHRFWLVASLGFYAGQVELLVSRSRDGLTWSPPVTAGQSVEDGYDKEWITCDNWGTSRHRGRCYLAYVDFGSTSVQVRRSNDGGRSWSAPATWASAPSLRLTLNGVQPVVRPNGTLVVPFAVFERFGNPSRIAVVRSLDGGTSLEPPVTATDIEGNDVAQVRSAPLPSVAIDDGGTIWMTWDDCRFVENCDAEGIVVSRSSDGVSWSEPVPVPAGPSGPTVDHFLPAIAVTGGERRPARLGVVSYSLPQGIGCGYSCVGRVDAWLSVSSAGRLDWARSQRLTTHPMRLAWIVKTGVGAMLGDYIAISWVAGHPVPVFAIASQPIGSSLRQAIFATTRVP